MQEGSDRPWHLTTRRRIHDLLVVLHSHDGPPLSPAPPPTPCRLTAACRRDRRRTRATRPRDARTARSPPGPDVAHSSICRSPFGVAECRDHARIISSRLGRSCGSRWRDSNERAKNERRGLESHPPVARRSIDWPAHPDTAHRRAGPVPTGIGHAHTDTGIRDADADTDGCSGPTCWNDERQDEKEHAARISQGDHRCRSID